MASPRLPEKMIEASYYLWKGEEAIVAEDSKSRYYMDQFFNVIDEAITEVHAENKDKHCMLQMRGTLNQVAIARVHINAWLEGNDRWNYNMFRVCSGDIARTHSELKTLLVDDWGYSKPTMRDYAKYGAGGNCC